MKVETYLRLTPLHPQNLSMQTEAPPSTTFAQTAGPAEINEAYWANYELLLAQEREREREEREQERAGDIDRERGSRGKRVSVRMQGRREGRRGA